jgi:hypothetical protein
VLAAQRTGLIGHTGFVGGTLARAAPFDVRVNSTTVDELRGQHFGLLVCAGVSAVKWRANQAPEADRAGIARLTGALAETQADELVLISTIDVYPDPSAGGDEATPIDPASNHAYGRHRLELERWCAARFPLLRVVRLPAVFGTGLRKNAIYDLLNDNMVGSINPAGVFQWYPLGRLWTDIATARQADLRLVNLFTEPLAMSRIIDAAFPGAPVGPAVEPAPRYDTRTRHARLFGGDGGYVMAGDAVLDALLRYVAAARAGAP